MERSSLGMPAGLMIFYFKSWKRVFWYAGFIRDGRAHQINSAPSTVKLAIQRAWLQTVLTARQLQRATREQYSRTYIKLLYYLQLDETEPFLKHLRPRLDFDVCAHFCIIHKAGEPMTPAMG